MKIAVTVFAAVLVLSTAPTQASAADTSTESHPSTANLSAIAATRTYTKQPNGITHALADLAFCKLSEHSDLLRSSELATKALAAHLASLQPLHTSMKLPDVWLCKPESAPFTVQRDGQDPKTLSLTMRTPPLGQK